MGGKYIAKHILIFHKFNKISIRLIEGIYCFLCREITEGNKVKRKHNFVIICSKIFIVVIALNCSQRRKRFTV